MSLVTLNIQQLIESNPLNKLSTTSNNMLLTKLSELFTTEHQKLFLSSFYCYLNYDSRTDFVIDLDDVWKWLRFSQKIHAKTLLKKHFTIDIDYQSHSLVRENDPKLSTELYPHGGGSVKEKIMMNIRTFKSMCLLAKTSKAKEIHEYYIDLEEAILFTIQQESNMLIKQLREQEQLNQKLTRRIRSKLKRKYKNGHCIYIITAGKNPTYFKIGKTNNLTNRLSELQTGCPEELQIINHWFSIFNYNIEQIILEAFKNFKNSLTTEWIEIDQLQNAINLIEQLLSPLKSYEQDIPEIIPEIFDDELNLNHEEMLKQELEDDKRFTPTKNCSKCKNDVYITKFYTKKNGNPRSICIKCMNKAEREYKLQLKHSSDGNKIKCNNCNQLLNPKLFFIYQNTKEYYSECIICYNKLNNKMVKQCNVCYELKNRTEFHSDKSRNDKCREQCKICRNHIERQKRKQKS